MTYILFLGVVLSGCSGLGVQSSIEESTVDSELVETHVPVSPPEADPGEPQKGFEQETADAQGL